MQFTAEKNALTARRGGEALRIEWEWDEISKTALLCYESGGECVIIEAEAK